jgi:chromosome segregation ATPase
LSASVALSAADKSNPLGTVFELIASLEAKIIKEGEAEAKTFKEFFQWCDEASQNVQYDIKTGESNQKKLEAKIGQLTSDIDVSDSKIGELAAAISAADGDLKAATEIRDKEAADFAVSEKELVDTVDTLDRAISIISSEMAKNPAALAQIDTSSMTSLVQSLGAVVDAAGFSTTDRQKLLTLVQSKQSDDDSDVGAPAASVYKSHSTDIVGVLEDLKEKAEGELSEARKAESNAKHNFNMMKQSLEDQMAADNKDLTNQKSGKAMAEEDKATAEGDLAVTVKDLQNSKDSLQTANTDCMTTAADHEATVAARNEELKILATAKKILTESSSGAEAQTYSFLQASSYSQLHTRADLANSEVINLIKKLARTQHSAALAQLASRIATVIKYGDRNGNDPFAKVKSLISDMILKLEAEANSEATEKAYCDEQIAKTEAKKSELEATVSKLTSRIDRAAAKSAGLKSEVKTLQGELAALAKQQAEMDQIRSESHAAYATAKSELTEGLAGVRKALSVLRDYYGSAAAMIQKDSDFMQQPAQPALHEKAAGAGGSIIDILEVVESDFATNLAKEETEEADAAADYERTTQGNRVTKTIKDQGFKYKTQEATALDKEISELSSDRDTTNNELAAVNEYYGQIRGRCIAKPETYEERRERREAEINGLKEALSILEGETAFLQRRHRMRGSAGKLE